MTEYVEGQTRDETVEHAEKIARERVFGRQYEVWDVHTDVERWWVVTGLTNLYSQKTFKSMDDVLSYHIGLITRVSARQARTAPDTPDSRLERTRRQWEQAAEAQNEADEAEEFQAVGMRCRETLVSLVQAVASEGLVPAGDEAPKASDFIHWTDLIANAVAAGDGERRLRGYLKTIARETWEYVSWLTHAKNATRFDGDMAVDFTGHFLGAFESAVQRKESGAPGRCPGCASYRLAEDLLFDETDRSLVYIRLCEACDWSEEFEPEPLGTPPPPMAHLPEGGCVPGHGPMARLPTHSPVSRDEANAARIEQPPTDERKR